MSRRAPAAHVTRASRAHATRASRARAAWTGVTGTGAAAPFPPVRVIIPLGWTAVLALVVAAVPVLAAAVAAAHRPDPAAQLRAGESA